MPYRIEVTDLARGELNAIRAFERRTIVARIREQLSQQPTTATRNCKPLESVVPSFDAVPPIWELRVDEYRVFYDVNEVEQIVYIRAVRRKEQGQTTEDIL